MVCIGVDAVDVGRFGEMLARRGATLEDRVFTAGELAACRGRPERLAARLAAKEAVAKALGTGIGPIAWRDVEVVAQQGGAPAVRLSGAAQALASERGLGEWKVTLTHTSRLAVAVVLGIGRQPTRPVVEGAPA